MRPNQSAARMLQRSLSWKVSFLDVMRFTIMVAFISVVTVGCVPSERDRMRPYELREVKCIRTYANGDVQVARQALLDYLHLLEEEEASGLPFRKTSYTKALAAARLTLISRELGETNLADQYMRMAVGYAR